MSDWTRIDVPDKEFREANETFREIGFDTMAFSATPVMFEHLPTNYVEAEWRTKNGSIEAHVFYRGRGLDLAWDHAGYAYALFGAIVKEFYMEQYQDRITVEFVPEVNGWYILIGGVAMLKDPDPSRLVKIFDSVRP